MPRTSYKTRRERRLLRRQKQREENKKRIQARFELAMRRYTTRMISWLQLKNGKGRMPKPPRNPLVQITFREGLAKFFRKPDLELFSRMVPQDTPWSSWATQPPLHPGLKMHSRLLPRRSDGPMHVSKSAFTIKDIPLPSGGPDANGDIWPERWPRETLEQAREAYATHPTDLDAWKFSKLLGDAKQGPQWPVVGFSDSEKVPADTTIMPGDLDRFINLGGTILVRFYKEPVVGQRFHLTEWIFGTHARRALVEVVSFETKETTMHMTTVKLIKLDGFVEEG